MTQESKKQIISQTDGYYLLTFKFKFNMKEWIHTSPAVLEARSWSC